MCLWIVMCEGVMNKALAGPEGIQEESLWDKE